MWRIKYHHLKGIVRIIHFGKIAYLVGMYIQFPTVTENIFLVSYILKQNIRIFLVKPKHSASTTSV